MKNNNVKFLPAYESPIFMSNIIEQLGSIRTSVKALESLFQNISIETSNENVK